MIEMEECINKVRCLSDQDPYYKFLYRDIIDTDLSKSNETMITEDMVFQNRFTPDEIVLIDRMKNLTVNIFKYQDFIDLIQKYFIEYENYKFNLQRKNIDNKISYDKLIDEIKLLLVNFIFFSKNTHAGITINELIKFHSLPRKIICSTNFQALYKCHLEFIDIAFYKLFTRKGLHSPPLIFLSPSALGFFALQHTLFNEKSKFNYEGSTKNCIEFVSSLNLISLVYMHPQNLPFNQEININILKTTLFSNEVIYKKYDSIFSNKWFIYIVHNLFNSDVLITVINIKAHFIGKTLYKQMCQVQNSNTNNILSYTNQMYYMLHLSIMFLNDETINLYFQNDDKKIESTAIFAKIKNHMMEKELIDKFVNSNAFKKFYYMYVMPKIIHFLHIITDFARHKTMIDMLYYIMPRPYRKDDEPLPNICFESEDNIDMNFLYITSKSPRDLFISEYFNIALNVIFEVYMGVYIDFIEIGLFK
ncbi:hypothetical protein COBT_002168 [Conglomerata obtusa]